MTQPSAAKSSRSEGEERRLALVLLLLTSVSGLVDAASYLTLGHVFVANLTGNILFLGFTLAGASGFSLISSLVAVGAFFTGAIGATRLARARPMMKPELLRTMIGIELLLVISAIVVGHGVAGPGSIPAFAMVAMMAGSNGIQSATTSRLQIGGFNSTVVLTTMIGTLAAASRLAGGSGTDNGRRIGAILCMLAGGFVGALLALHMGRWAALSLAAFVLLVAGLGAHVIASQPKRLVPVAA